MMRRLISLLGAVATGSAVRLARSIFMTPRRYPPRPWELEALEDAEHLWITPELHCLAWGEGKPVLLMHGWEGRASQMSVFRSHLSSGYRLIAIDAPAHGQSKGRRSNPHEFIKAIFAAQDHFGRFHAIVGHSMGGGCALYCALEGLDVQKIVSISGPARFADTVASFGRFMGLEQANLQRFLEAVETEAELPFADVDLSTRIENLTQSVLIVHDRDDREVPFAQAERYCLSRENHRLLATAGLGHRQIMRDETVLKSVADFIQTDQCGRSEVAPRVSLHLSERKDFRTSSTA